MDMLRDSTGEREVVTSSMNAPLPKTIENDLGGRFFEDDDDLAQVLQDQEILYQLVQGNDGIRSSRTHSIPRSSYDGDLMSNEQTPSGVANYEFQLADDEALARELQAMENQLANTSLNNNNERINPTPSPASNSSRGSPSTLPQGIAADEIDSDNMTYEELQELGETIGTESKGLPESAIALLPTSTYKSGMFSKKMRHNECTICSMTYKNRDKLTKLPCKHQYHQSCATKWLQIKKVCPLCNMEVVVS